MSRMIIEAAVPQQRLPASSWSRRLSAALTLGIVMMAIGFAYPSSGMSMVFVDDSVPQIVTNNGP